MNIPTEQEFYEWREDTKVAFRTHAVSTNDIYHWVTFSMNTYAEIIIDRDGKVAYKGKNYRKATKVFEDLINENR